MVFRYTPDGVCSSEMIFEIDGDIVKKLEIVGGCPGNTVGVSKLIENRNVDDIIELLRGIPCRNKGTSCPDQVAKALEEYKKQQKDSISV